MPEIAADARRVAAVALAEDGPRDVTSDASVLPGQWAVGVIRSPRDARARGMRPMPTPSRPAAACRRSCGELGRASRLMPVPDLGTLTWCPGRNSAGGTAAAQRPAASLWHRHDHPTVCRGRGLDSLRCAPHAQDDAGTSRFRSRCRMRRRRRPASRRSLARHTDQGQPLAGTTPERPIAGDGTCRRDRERHH